MALFAPNVETASGRFFARAGLLLLAVVFLAAGALGVWRLALEPLYNLWRSRDWQQVMTKIETVRLEHDWQGVRVQVRYAYRINGVTYRSGRYGLYRNMSNAAAARAAYEELLFRRKAWAWVNPAAPKEALLERKIHPLTTLTAIPAAGVGLLGAALIWAAMTAFLQGWRERRERLHQP
ncbi:hypothetical protein AGMMS49545_12080 [Betaproteobacteria bacterium]|nr:hypothetical protein AGMMS49545_12080 [Betaproteobacteria bacterium]GHU42632.1 hypothetical protein AGMMS50289_07660 [Betaproteobacteria bacterium]